MNALFFIAMILIGILFGTLSILVGIGGGLLNVPFLIYVVGLDAYSASWVSSFIIMFTSFSGFVRYYKDGRVDLKTAGLYLLLAIPGSILGAYTASIIDRTQLRQAFAIIVLFAGIRGVIKANYKVKPEKKQTEFNKESTSYRKLVTKDNDVYEYNVKLKIGLPLIFLGGYVAGLVGIGGGLVYVPTLTAVSGLPVHVAVPTSSTMIVVVGFVSFLSKSLSAPFPLDYSYLYLYGLPLAIGAVTGAQIGARRLRRLNSRVILTLFWSIAILSGFKMLFL